MQSQKGYHIMSLHVHLPTDFLMWESMWDRGILLAGWILWEMWECRNVGSWVLYKESHRFFRGTSH